MVLIKQMYQCELSFIQSFRTVVFWLIDVRFLLYSEAL